MATNSSWSDAATYYANRAVASWNNMGISGSSDRNQLVNQTIINGGMKNDVGPLWSNGSDIYNGVQLGPSWLNESECMKDMITTATKNQSSVCNFSRDSGSFCFSSKGPTCDTNWCNRLNIYQQEEPSSCSNNRNFSKLSIEDVNFANNVGKLDFGSLTVMVTIDMSNAKYSDPAPFVANMPNGKMKSAMTSSLWSGGPEHVGMTAWESGEISESTSNSYGYGPDGTKNKPQDANGALQAKDTVEFNLAAISQTLQKCGGNCGEVCCDLLTSTRDNCFRGLSDGYCSVYGTGNGNAFSALFQPFQKFFSVLVDKSGLICETQTNNDGSSCVMFNGVVQDIDLLKNPNTTLYAYDANPYKDPSKLYKGPGPTVGVPIKFSLMYSADGSSPSTGSYLAQFLNPTSVAGANQNASSYKDSKGFNALGEFWDRLNSSAPSSGSSAYSGFVKVYYAYAVSNCFLLSLYQLAPFLSKEPMLSVFGLFRTSAEWKSDVVDVWNDLNADLQPLTASDFFQNSQPQLSAIDSNGQIEVKITVPSLLLGWIDKHLGELLLLMFPRTGAGYKVTSSFTVASAYSQIKAQAPSTEQTVFQIVDGTTQTTYYSVKTDSPGPVPQQGSSNSTDTVTIGAQVSFKVQVGAQSMTLLFYLLYLSQNKLSPITDYSDFILKSAPAIQPVPSLLNWASACAIMDDGQCLNQDGYTNNGSSPVNSLFLNKNTPVCKCIYPANVQSGLEADAVWDNAALCFNAYCQSNDTTTIDLQSILAGDQDKACPTGATAIADVVDGVITKVTVVTAGRNYGRVPAVLFTGSKGSGAKAEAAIDADGSVTSVSVTSGGSGYTDSVVVVFEPETNSDAPAYDCSSQCKSYINILTNEQVDMSAVNLTALSNDCDFDITRASSGFNNQWTVYAIFALLVASMPLVFISTAAVSSSTVLQPSFYVPVLIVFLLMLAAAAYVWLDLRGQQTCKGAKFKDGYYWPTSTCMSRGLFGLLPKYNIPDGFCQDKRSYCQCSKVKGNEIKCSPGSCGCADDSCCSDVGICTAPDGAANPYKGRNLLATVENQRFRPLVAALSVAIAIGTVPAAVLAFWYGSAKDVRGKPYVAAVIGVAVLAFCAIPLLVQGFVPSVYKTFVLGVGKCVQLEGYPTKLVWTDNVSTVYTSDNKETGTPSYVKTVSASCSSCCKSNCGADCNGTKGCACSDQCQEFPPPNIQYDAGRQTWTATYGGDNEAIYVNDPSSTSVYAGSGSSPALFSRFTNIDDSSKSFDICGVLNDVSSCGNCACSAVVKSS